MNTISVRKLPTSGATAYLCAFGIFVFETQVDTGVVHPLLVLFPIWFAYRTGSKVSLFRMGHLCTGLAVAGIFLFPDTGPPLLIALNCAVSVVLIWGAVALAHHATSISENLAVQLESSQRLNAALQNEQQEDARKRRILMSAMEDVRLEIERRKELEIELKNLVQQLETANFELESFSYFTSHDLQEPLRTISSYADLLREDLAAGATADVDEDLKFMTNGVERMIRLVQDLLAYSRTGRHALSLETHRT